MWDIVERPIGLVLICAFRYSAATIAMKSSSIEHNPVTGLMIILFLGASVLAEIKLLKTAELGLVYVAILGVETLIILLATQLMGEGMSSREMVGAGMVIGGAIIISV